MGIISSKNYFCMGCAGQNYSSFSENSSFSQFPLSTSMTLFAPSVASESHFDLNEELESRESVYDFDLPELPLPEPTEECIPDVLEKEIKLWDEENKLINDSTDETSLYKNETHQIFFKGISELSDLETNSATWKFNEGELKMPYTRGFSDISVEELLERAESRLTASSNTSINSVSKTPRKGSLVDYRNEGGKNIVEVIRSQGGNKKNEINALRIKNDKINLSLTNRQDNNKRKNEGNNLIRSQSIRMTQKRKL
ncbi:unnamed protein product [Blepharisma stoltei]|uniref:Uncharacterized protein n=1 Tax=Blepharisma stoltei TaxID=1481888 RepID=A0AAU9KDY0_9CILI|nr:unnamed protein product [Blepharisma stoltei]